MDQNFLNTLTEAITHINGPRLLRSGLVIVLTIVLMIVMRIAYSHYRKKIEQTGDVDSLRKVHTLRSVYRISKIVVIITCVLIVLQVIGINISSIVLLLSVFAAMLAFGIKDMFQDFFAGFIIMTDKYFKVGDAVEFEGKEGIVISFTMRSTKIELLDDRSVLSIANRNISKIRRLNHLVDIDLPISYDVDREEVFSVLSDICENIKKLEGVENCELKGTQNFDDSAILYKIRFFCEPNDRPDIRRAVLKTIQDGLHEANIRIPYQQLDIHQK